MIPCMSSTHTIVWAWALWVAIHCIWNTMSGPPSMSNANVSCENWVEIYIFCSYIHKKAAINYNKINVPEVCILCVNKQKLDPTYYPTIILCLQKLSKKYSTSKRDSNINNSSSLLPYRKPSYRHPNNYSVHIGRDISVFLQWTYKRWLHSVMPLYLAFLQSYKDWQEWLVIACTAEITHTLCISFETLRVLKKHWVTR